MVNAGLYLVARMFPLFSEHHFEGDLSDLAMLIAWVGGITACMAAFIAFVANDIKVLGISKDGPTSHTKFINKYQIPFTLLSDTEPCPVASSYESYGLKKFMGREYMGMMRHTFLVDEEGKLERIYLKVKAATMADTLISDLGLS